MPPPPPPPSVGYRSDCLDSGMSSISFELSFSTYVRLSDMHGQLEREGNFLENGALVG